MSHPFEATAADAAPDDRFFVLRDCRALLQRRLAETARLAGGLPQSAIDRFADAVGDKHDELAAATRSDGFDQITGLTASRITLMCDADLEIDIRIGDIARHLVDVGGNALWQLQRRYMTLLGRAEMPPEGNPAGPEAIADGLWAVCRAVDAGLERNLALLERLATQLDAQLAGIYAELNELLAARGIEPAQAQISTRSDGRTAGGAGAAMEGHPAAAPSSTDPLAALQQALNLQFGGAAGGSASPSAGHEATAPTAGNLTLNAATLVMLNQLTERLERLQQSGLTAAAGTSMPAGDGVPQHAFKAADLDLPLGKPEAVVLETLGHIFEAIFTTWALPDTVKTAISRLQIPYFRLAMCDPALFSDNTHPARRLVNAMGRASVGVPRNIDRAHPVSKRLWQIVGNVAESLQGDAGVLAAPLAEIDALIAERDAAARAGVQACIPFLVAREAAGKATEAVDRWLRETTAAGSAREILDFIAHDWVRVMAAVAVSDGIFSDDSAAWKEAHQTAVDLMWSVQPKRDADERKRLAALVPNLIRRINAGLDRIGVSPQERAPFLDACFNLQTACLRGSPPPIVNLDAPARSAPSAPASATPPAALPMEAVDVGGCCLKIVGNATTNRAAYRSAGVGVQSGQWLQFALGDETLCGMVVWISPQSGCLLLANPDWKQALALPADLAAAQLKSGQARVMSSSDLFDRAAERALAQIAKGGAKH